MTAYPVTFNIEDLITQDVIEEYNERGYWVSPKLFTDEQIERLRDAHARMWDGDNDRDIPSQYGIRQVEPDSPRVRQQCNGFWLNDEIRDAVTSPILGAIGARFMNVDSVRLWHDQVIHKPGIGAEGSTNEGNVGWHQDYGYWQSSSTTNMCTAWVALQDTDLSNGGMRTVVGSHKWGLIEGSDMFGTQDLETLAEQFAASTGQEWLDEPCILKAGEVSFHHCLTFHGSGPNFTDYPRLCIISHMMPGDTTYRAGVQWHPNLVFFGPNAQHGQAFDNDDYFPLMWPERNN